MSKALEVWLNLFSSYFIESVLNFSLIYWFDLVNLQEQWPSEH